MRGRDEKFRLCKIIWFMVKELRLLNVLCNGLVVCFRYSLFHSLHITILRLLYFFMVIYIFDTSHLFLIQFRIHTHTHTSYIFPEIQRRIETE